MIYLKKDYAHSKWRSSYDDDKGEVHVANLDTTIYLRLSHLSRLVGLADRWGEGLHHTLCYFSGMAIKASQQFSTMTLQIPLELGTENSPVFSSGIMLDQQPWQSN